MNRKRSLSRFAGQRRGNDISTAAQYATAGYFDHIGGTPYQILNGGAQFLQTEAASTCVVTRISLKPTAFAGQAMKALMEMKKTDPAGLEHASHEYMHRRDK